MPETEFDDDDYVDDSQATGPITPTEGGPHSDADDDTEPVDESEIDPDDEDDDQ